MSEEADEPTGRGNMINNEAGVQWRHVDDLYFAETSRNETSVDTMDYTPNLDNKMDSTNNLYNNMDKTHNLEKGYEVIQGPLRFKV